MSSRLRQEMERLLGRPIPSTEDVDDTAADLAAYVDKIEEIDRNARAYGWETHKRGRLTDQGPCSDDNPFLDPDWRSKIES